MRKILIFYAIALQTAAMAQTDGTDKFEQLQSELPTPNVYRTASGAPGAQYWQQRADYDIAVRLDEDKHELYGEETVTYYNNSPDKLNYIWLQLDQNRRAKDSDTYKISESDLDERITYDGLKNLSPWFDGGFKLDTVTDTRGKPLKYTVNKTMMRIDLPSPLVPGGAFSFKIDWHYLINNRLEIGGRSGYELFEEENNALYTIAQFYPRLAVYSDVEGWQNKQFLGAGEFALSFGNFDVRITVPSDHMVASTGECQNMREVLTEKQIQRYNQAKTADRPVVILTEAEAREIEKGRSTKMKTWHFKAENVRDFGWASSRKFIWDAQGKKFGDRTVMAMSYYPKEGNPLWERFSTPAVMQTLETYSKHTFDYPYPVAISVNAASIGMEYPMICFNFGRTEEDGTYSERTKYGMIGVIIHEVGHNYFPMIVNSDERQWTWMDEGLNSFLQVLTEQEFERGFPSRRLEPRQIVSYMKGDKAFISPIMTNSESIHQFGNNAYGKPAIGLNMLRETIMGRELFDFAFKTYAQRWMFKHPSPADFFRTMEDASAVDLDWFWRGWFYSTHAVDLSIDEVQYRRIAEGAASAKNERDFDKSITDMRNATAIEKTREERDTTLVDFYTKARAFELNSQLMDNGEDDQSMVEEYSEEESAMNKDDRHFYQISFTNQGGLVMPLIVQFVFENGETEIQQIPVEIWRKGAKTVTKVFITDQKAKNIILDPYQQTADIDLSNNSWKEMPTPTRLQLYKASERQKEKNEMQQAK